MASKSNTQLAKFKKAARDLGTDDNEAHFNKKLVKIARQKPNVSKPNKTKKG